MTGSTAEWQHEIDGQVNQAPSILEHESFAVHAASVGSVGNGWLPVGHHWDLHIEHAPLEDGGALTGGGDKLVWHTTESEWETVDAMFGVLRDKRAAPHFVIGKRRGVLHPVVIQMIPLGRAGRALEHPAGTLATNSADAVQVEICGRAAESTKWPLSRYRALANLTGLIAHRVHIPAVAPIDFSHPRRMSPQEWIAAKGHVGHSMAPNNSHTDPGRFREGLLLKDLLPHVPHKL